MSADLVVSADLGVSADLVAQRYAMGRLGV